MVARVPDAPVRGATDVVQVQQPAVRLILGNDHPRGRAARPPRPHAHRHVLRIGAAHLGQPPGDHVDLGLHGPSALGGGINRPAGSSLRAGLHPLDNQPPAPFVVAVAQDHLVAVTADAAPLHECALLLDRARQIPQPLRAAQLGQHVECRRERASQDHRVGGARDRFKHDLLQHRRPGNRYVLAHVRPVGQRRRNPQRIGPRVQRREFIPAVGAGEHGGSHRIRCDELHLDALERCSGRQADGAAGAAGHRGRHRPGVRLRLVVRVLRRVLILVAARRAPQIADQVSHVGIGERVPEGRHARAAVPDLCRNRIVRGGPLGQVMERRSDDPTQVALAGDLLVAHPALVEVDRLSARHSARGHLVVLQHFVRALEPIHQQLAGAGSLLRSELHQPDAEQGAGQDHRSAEPCALHRSHAFQRLRGPEPPSGDQHERTALIGR